MDEIKQKIQLLNKLSSNRVTSDEIVLLLGKYAGLVALGVTEACCPCDAPLAPMIVAILEAHAAQIKKDYQVTPEDVESFRKTIGPTVADCFTNYLDCFREVSGGNIHETKQ